MNEASLPTPGSEEIDDDGLMADVDVEMALLALSAHDVGEPTEAIDLSSLSPTEKRVLLEMLRRRLYEGHAPTPLPTETSGSEPDTGQAAE